jgi:hypothetical protein
MSVREVLRLFQKLEMDIREGRDTIARLYVDGVLVVRTKVPHKRGELKGNLPHFIRQQLRLNEEEFADLRRCTIYRDDYVNILRKKGKI